MSVLNEIGLRAGTDKSSRDHDFLKFYDTRLEKLRDNSFCLIEIGVFHGESLCTWGEYFPNAAIVGLDINPEAASFKKLENTHIRIGDAGRLEDLDKLVEEFGNPLVFIDDGSHFWHHQVETLRYMWPRVLPGGFFILEDLHTSFPGLASDYKGCSTISGYDYLLQLNRWVVGNRFMAGEIPYDGFISTYWSTVESIQFYRGTAVLQKKSA